MPKQFKLDVISLTHAAYSGNVTSVTVPGVDGELTILADHIPVITPLKAGEMITRRENETIFTAISSGFLIVDPGRVTVLADSAE